MGGASHGRGRRGHGRGRGRAGRAREEQGEKGVFWLKGFRGLPHIVVHRQCREKWFYLNKLANFELKKKNISNK